MEGGREEKEICLVTEGEKERLRVAQSRTDPNKEVSGL